MTSSGWDSAPAVATAAIETAIALQRQIAKEFLRGISFEGLDRLVFREAQAVVGLRKPAAALL
jgi:hypothetical protein